jgi:integrase
MRGFRSKLAPVRRKKKDGSVYWAARGFVPVKRPDGTFARRRVELSLGGNTATARQEEVDRLNAAYEERALHDPLTFSRAYMNHIEHHAVPLYAEEILASLGERQCREINDTVMVELSRTLFGPHAKASYVNRHLYTPVLAILRMALKERAPQLARPKGHKESPAVAIPEKTWFKAVLPHMDTTTRALVSFLTMHGRRLGDALGRKPCDFNPESGTLLIDRTKNGDPVFLDLHPHVTTLLRQMPGWEERCWLFGDGPNSGSNVRRDIKAACEIAGVRYFSPHQLGRHSFATRMLRAGFSLQYVKDAGGWKSIEVLSRLYGHLERKEWTQGVHEVGSAFLTAISTNSGGKVGVEPPQQALTAP